MYTNRPACTVWEKGVQDRAAIYTRHVLGAVYWEDTRGESADSTSRDPDDKILCIAHKSSVTYMPKPDDKIMDGEINDLAPPRTALTVTAVKDYRYGTEDVQHIEVTAR